MKEAGLGIYVSEDFSKGNAAKNRPSSGEKSISHPAAGPFPLDKNIFTPRVLCHAVCAEYVRRVSLQVRMCPADKFPACLCESCLDAIAITLIHAQGFFVHKPVFFGRMFNGFSCIVSRS